MVPQVVALASTQRTAAEWEPMSVVNQVIEDRVGQGWVARRERGMPIVDR
jgi:hypothetical protein